MEQSSVLLRPWSRSRPLADASGTGTGTGTVLRRGGRRPRLTRSLACARRALPGCPASRQDAVPGRSPSPGGEGGGVPKTALPPRPCSPSGTPFPLSLSRHSFLSFGDFCHGGPWKPHLPAVPSAVLTAPAFPLPPSSAPRTAPCSTAPQHAVHVSQATAAEEEGREAILRSPPSLSTAAAHTARGRARAGGGQSGPPRVREAVLLTRQVQHTDAQQRRKDPMTAG